jgi:hypothetical protein
VVCPFLNLEPSAITGISHTPLWESFAVVGDGLSDFQVFAVNDDFGLRYIDTNNRW